MNIDSILQMSPPALLAGVLYLLGMLVRNVPKMPGWGIPLGLMVVGAIVYPHIAETGKVSYSVEHPAVFNALIGSAIGGFTTGLNQVFKQWRKEPEPITTAGTSSTTTPPQ